MLDFRLGSTSGPCSTHRNPDQTVKTQTVLLTLAVLLPLSCQTDGDTRGAKRGAAGGALVGLTMGALTGDASLAAKGAVAGGVAGGVAGSMSDLESDRNTERTQITADAIAGRTGEPAPTTLSRPESWDRLNDMTGKWRCAMWGLLPDGSKVSAKATITGTLQSTHSVKLAIDSFESDAGSLSGSATLAYNKDSGYELTSNLTDDGSSQRWIGELLAGSERYSFYYVGTKDTGIVGTAVSDHRMELRFLGKDVFVLETYEPAANGEAQVQSYRFTRID